MSDLIPWFGPKVAGGEIERLTDVLDRCFLNDGPLTREFEKRIAERVGVRHCVAVTSGTAALSLSLIGLGIGPGDEVIVPDLTFIATANAVRMTGADVKLVDIEPARLTVDVAAVEAAIGPRTRAVIPVDVNGRAADYPALEALCRRHGLKLVCDAAEALGSRFRGQALGSFGDAGCFSFSANKTVTTGQGGMVATNDEALYHRLLELKDQGRPVRGSGGDDPHPAVGYNFKFTDLQAAVGLAQLEVLDQRLEAAARRDRWYAEALAGIPGLTFPDMAEPGEARQWTDVLVEDRETLRAAYQANGIGHRALWFPLHTQPPYRLADQGFANAIAISARGLWLPSHFDLTADQVARVAQVTRQALRSR